VLSDSKHVRLLFDLLFNELIDLVVLLFLLFNELIALGVALVAFTGLLSVTATCDTGLCYTFSFTHSLRAFLLPNLTKRRRNFWLIVVQTQVRPRS